MKAWIEVVLVLAAVAGVTVSLYLGRQTVQRHFAPKLASGRVASAPASQRPDPELTLQTLQDIVKR